MQELNQVFPLDSCLVMGSYTPLPWNSYRCAVFGISHISRLFLVVFETVSCPGPSSIRPFVFQLPISNTISRKKLPHNSLRAPQAGDHRQSRFTWPSGVGQDGCS